jgi:hypothetical protein
VKAVAPADRSGRSNIQHDKTFLARRLGETLVERHDLKRSRAMFRGDECRGELERVSGMQRVDAKIEAACRRLAWIGGAQSRGSRPYPPDPKPSRPVDSRDWCATVSCGRAAPRCQPQRSGL